MNDFYPLVSIVIPVYNGSNYVQCAIDSALGQDYDNIEVIVVNDGSTDNTEEIVKNYGDKIRYFAKENGGVATALNLAIQNARGEYISWLSHDDYYLPNKVSRQIEELGKISIREKIIIFSNSNIHHVYNDQENDTVEIFIKTIYSCYLTKTESLKALFIGEIHGCSLLIPKNAFDTVGYFNKSLITTQDYYLWFTFIKAGYLFYCLPEILMVTRYHEKQDSKIKWNMSIHERLKLYEFAQMTFKKDLKIADKEIQLLLDKRLSYIRNEIKKNRFYYIILRKIIKIIPKQIKQFIKYILYRNVKRAK